MARRREYEENDCRENDHDNGDHDVPYPAHKNSVDLGISINPVTGSLDRGHINRSSGEGPNDGEGETPTDLGDAMPQKSEPIPSAQTAGAVKPQGPRLRVEASTVEPQNLISARVLNSKKSNGAIGLS